MYKILTALLLLLILTSCKKEKSQVDPQATTAVTVPFATLSGLSPSLVSTGMIVTLTGTNFGTSASNITVLFGNVKATIQFVTPTQITAVVPTLQLASGSVSVLIGSQTLTGLSYTTVAATPPALTTMNNISLTTQAQVDSFVIQNKGKQTQIAGGLILGNFLNKNSDIHDISGLSNITAVAGVLGVTHCPLLTDFSGFSNVTTAGSINFSGTGAVSITMDKLTTVKGISFIDNLFPSSINKALTKVSFKSLTNVDGNISFGSSPQLSTVDLSALTAMSGKLTLSNTLIIDMSGFTRLQTAGSLSFSNNTVLTSLQGLDHLTALTAPEIISLGANGDIGKMVGGICIADNSKLGSLAGLQNIAANTVPDIFITNNAALGDFCPLKGAINYTNTLATYEYSTYVVGPVVINFSTHTLAPVTLTNNGGYAQTSDVLTALTSCK